MHASEGIIQYYLSYSKYHGHDIEMKWNYGIHKTDGIRLLYGFAYFGYGLYWSPYCVYLLHDNSDVSVN